MSATEMIARRDATEQEIASLIGQLVFAYSRFVTGLHLCVAWHNDGKEVHLYGDNAEDFAAADLIRKIEAQAKNRLGATSSGFKKYKDWVKRAHSLRELRNVVMHSSWNIEAYGRHAIALNTPVFVEPKKEITINADQLRDACKSCDTLNIQLSKLRDEYSL